MEVQYLHDSSFLLEGEEGNCEGGGGEGEEGGVICSEELQLA